MPQDAWDGRRGPSLRTDDRVKQKNCFFPLNSLCSKDLVFVVHTYAGGNMVVKSPPSSSMRQAPSKLTEAGNRILIITYSYSKAE